MAASFDALGETLNQQDYVIAKYSCRTKKDLYDAAIELCKSQSTSGSEWGNSARALAETDEIIARHGVKLAGIQDKGENPFSFQNTGEITLAYPIVNFGASLSKLLTALTGEAGYLRTFDQIKLEDASFPDKYLEQFRGPKFGAQGICALSGNPQRPLIIAVVKPSVGIGNAELYARLAYESLVGGADIVKDDELLADESYSRLEERVRAVANAVQKAKEKTGKPKMYMANITGDNPLELYKTAKSSGADAVMINAWAVGLPAARQISELSEVPLFSHFDNRWVYGRNNNGISYKVLSLLDRIAGIDGIIMPSPEGSLFEKREEILQEIGSCTKPLGHLRQSLPCLGGGVSALNIAENSKIISSNNAGYIVGHGIFSHPDGAEAGAKSILQALTGTDGPELQRAKEGFRKPSLIRRIWDRIPLSYKIVAAAVGLVSAMALFGERNTHSCSQQHYEFDFRYGEYTQKLVCPHK